MTLRVRELDYGKLGEHIAVHLEQGTHIPKEDIEAAVRMIMISVRQEVKIVNLPQAKRDREKLAEILWDTGYKTPWKEVKEDKRKLWKTQVEVHYKMADAIISAFPAGKTEDVKQLEETLADCRAIIEWQEKKIDELKTEPPATVALDEDMTIELIANFIHRSNLMEAGSIIELAHLICSKFHLPAQRVPSVEEIRSVINKKENEFDVNSSFKYQVSLAQSIVDYLKGEGR